MTDCSGLNLDPNRGSATDFDYGDAFLDFFFGPGFYLSKPMNIDSNTNWKMISVKFTSYRSGNQNAGNLGAFVIKRDGTLWFWGQATQGESGMGLWSVDPNNFPTVASGGTGYPTNGDFFVSIRGGTPYRTPMNIEVTSNNTGIVNGINNYTSIYNDVIDFWFGIQRYQNQTNLFYITPPTNPVSTTGPKNFPANALASGVPTTGSGATVNIRWVQDYASFQSPTQVGSDTDWAYVSAGIENTLLIKTNGTLWGCGYNQGLNDTVNFAGIEPVPIQIGSDTDWLRVRAGDLTTVAIKTDGSMYRWGYNQFGNCGLGMTSPEVTTPTRIGTDLWNHVVVGENHAIAIHQSGALYAWGKNTQGQLGVGDFVDRHSPTLIDIGPWKKILIGNDGNASFALKRDGTIWAWGDNSGFTVGGNPKTYSQADIDTGNNSIHIPRHGFSNLDIVYSVAMSSAQDSHTGLPDGIRLGTFGGPPPVTYTIILVDADHIKLSSNGGVSPITLTNSDIIDGGLVKRYLKVPNQIGSASNWKDIAVGTDFAYALNTSNELWQWGLNQSSTDFYGVSTGFWDVRFGTPRSFIPFKLLSSVNFNSMFAGRKNAFFISGSSFPALQASNVYHAGEKASGFYPGVLRTSTPPNKTVAQVQSPYRTLQFSKIFSGTFGIKSDGTLWAWGRNTTSQLGIDSIYNIVFSEPIQIGTDTDWAFVANSSTSSAGLKTNGHLYTWGIAGIIGVTGGDYTPTGRSADLTIRQVTRPTQLGTDTWLMISVAEQAMAGIKSDGTLWGWGDNAAGQFGQGTNTNVSIPVQIDPAHTYISVAVGMIAGFNHLLAVRSDGTLWSAGYNANCQLGLNDTTNRNILTQVGSATTWVSVAAGLNQIGFGIRSNGTLWSWGGSRHGELGQGFAVGGNGHLQQITVPTQVGVATDWLNAKISIGGTETAILKSNGTVWVCGENFMGELGIGTRTPTGTFTQINADTDWTSVSFASEWYALLLTK